MIPLFDSLTHVTADERWFGTHHNASVERLLDSLDGASIHKACVVGIHGYNMPNDFILRACAVDPTRLVPIAGFDPMRFSTEAEIQREVESLHIRGFAGIKVHPTLCSVPLNGNELAWTFAAVENVGIPLFLCTVVRRRGLVNCAPAIDTLYRHLAAHPGAKVLLLHGGVHELLGYADMARGLPNVLVDLSWTVLKYEGSSLEHDFRYLLQHLDRKVVVGSDFPEFTPQALRVRMEALCKGLDATKVENIFWRNLDRFLGFSGGDDAP